MPDTNGKHALPVLFNCEHGLGKLTERACGQRWAIAHGKLPADRRNADGTAVKNSPCRTCTYGEARVVGPLREQCGLPPVGSKPPPEPTPVAEPKLVDEDPPASVRKHGGGRRRAGELKKNSNGTYSARVIVGERGSRERKQMQLGTKDETEAKQRMEALVVGKPTQEAVDVVKRSIGELSESREFTRVTLELTSDELDELRRAKEIHDRDEARAAGSLAAWIRRAALEHAQVVCYEHDRELERQQRKG